MTFVIDTYVSGILNNNKTQGKQAYIEGKKARVGFEKQRNILKDKT